MFLLPFPKALKSYSSTGLFIIVHFVTFYCSPLLLYWHTTNENITLSALAVTGSINISSNGGNIFFGKLEVGNALYLTVKNGNIEGTVIGSYDDFAIRSEIKKGKSNLPDNKTGGEKTLNVSSNNGNVNIELVNDES